MFVLSLIATAIGFVIPLVGGAIIGVFLEVFFGKSLALMLNEAIGPS